MDNKHRRIILGKIDKLIECTDYHKLVNGCVQSGIISSVMKNIIEKLPDEEHHRALFVKLTKRGPKAYELLHDLFSKLKYEKASMYLLNDETEFISISKRKLNKDIQPSWNGGTKTSHAILTDGQTISKDVTDNNKNNSITLQKHEYKLKLEYLKPVRKSDKIHSTKNESIQVYPMKSRNRGVFFMVNIINFPNKKDRRNGAELDGESLLNLFHELGYDLFKYNDLTLEEFHLLLDEIIDSDYTKKAESFVMALMTHGEMVNQSDRVQFSDGSLEKVYNILDKFKNDVCVNLVKKPKIFIFPFCRGPYVDKGTFKRVEFDGFSNRSITNIPTYSDMFICYASVPGFQTHRDPEQGSWYIQIFYEVFAEHAHDTELDDMLKIIGERTGHLRTEENSLQTTSSSNFGFNKKLFFNPGFYDDRK